MQVRADRSLVRIYSAGQPVKTHPRQDPGGRSTDPADLPPAKAVYALRDHDELRRRAGGHGPAVAAYVDALLDTPQPWSAMRHVYALLDLAERWGSTRVDAACARALELDAVNVNLVARMLAAGTEGEPVPAPAPTPPVPPGRAPRFARDPSHFALRTATGR